MGTFSRFVVAILLLVIILGGLFGYKFYQIGQMQAQFSQPQPVTVVEATEVGTVTWQPTIKSVGSTRAINGIEVANELPGVIEKVMFESGQRVKAGDELVRLDSAIDQAALTTRKAEAMLASKEYKRNADLISKRAVSQSAVDETQSAMETAKARVQEAEAQLSKKVLRAPFDGVLGLRLVDLGQYLPAGTSIVEINMLDPILVQYTLSERELANVDIGDRVEVSVAAMPKETFKGTVSAINSSVTAASRTVQLRAKIANADQRLKPGMFATIQTLAEDERAVVTIPNTAIAYNTYGNFAYVLAENEDGQLMTERRTIQTGEMRDGMTEVLKGLKVGERIVSTGLLRLRAGQPVDIKKAESDAAATSAGAQ